MKKALLKQTFTDYKNKLFSSLNLFLIMMAAYFIIVIPCFTAIGTIYTYEQLYFSYIINSDSFFILEILLPSTIFALIFFIIHNIRNNYLNYLPFGSSRDSYLLSDISAGITYSALIGIVTFIAQVSIFLIMNHSNRLYTIEASYDMNLGIAFGNIMTSFFISLAAFFIVSNITNSIVRKKWLLLLINIAVPIICIIIVMCIPTFDDDINSKFTEAYYDFISSWWGISIIATLFSAMYQSFNYVLIRKGGIRR